LSTSKQHTLKRLAQCTAHSALARTRSGMPRKNSQDALGIMGLEAITVGEEEQIYSKQFE
jgi:hypothetical protein